MLELGPCFINASYESEINPYSWSEVSNLLFLSQPLGVGMCLQFRLEKYESNIWQGSRIARKNLGR